MQLSSKSPECWSSSAMEGLTQSYMFKQKLLNCEPLDLSWFVVDRGDRHLELWTPLSDSYPALRAQQQNAYLSPVVRTACKQLHKQLHKKLCLLPILLIGWDQVHTSRLSSRCHLQCASFHTLCPHPSLETATWNSTISPTCG